MGQRPGDQRHAGGPGLRHERLQLTLIQALEALRDGLRPFVVKVLEEKEGERWHEHPRIQRMIPVPPALQGDTPQEPEEPVLDLALLLKILASDSYWYRTFRLRLPGISHWQIDSLRELRNRVAHDDGDDPLLSNSALVLPYLATIEQLLTVIGSEKAEVIRQLRAPLLHSRWKFWEEMALGRSRWSVPFWLALIAVVGASAWLIDYLRSPRLERTSVVIGTPDRRLERYLPLEKDLESRLRPANLWHAIRGDKIDVRVEGARSYPEAVASLRAKQWDVLLGFSPVVSMEAETVGYKPIGRMFPHEPEYSSILFTRAGSALQRIEDITSSTRVALGDFFSATKYYVPMSLLRGRSAEITLNLSTKEIADLVRNGKADVGVMAGNLKRFETMNPGLRVLASSDLLPQSLVALSPELSDLDRDRLREALFSVPAELRGVQTANYAPAKAPDYRLLNRQVAEGKAFSACLRKREGGLTLRCPQGSRVELIEGWIEDIRTEDSLIKLEVLTIDRRTMTFAVEKDLLDQSAIFQVLQDLKGRMVRVIVSGNSLNESPIVLETPHQLEIRS